jgi:2-C-methyl-D-erythritol 4-phosphate cytidylyltransferase
MSRGTVNVAAMSSCCIDSLTEETIATIKEIRDTLISCKGDITEYLDRIELLLVQIEANTNQG